MSVVQASEEAVPYGEFGQLLAQVSGMNAVDAATRMRQCPGNLLVSGLTPQAAQAFVAGLQQRNIPALVIPDNQLLKVAGERRLRGLSVGQDQVVLEINGSETPEYYPFETALLLQGGMLLIDEQETKTETIKERGPRGTVRTTVVQKTETKSVPNLTFDLYIKTGPTSVHRFRIDPKRMNYAGLGDRLESSSAANLKLLIGDLKERIPHLLLTEGVKRYLEGQNLREVKAKDFRGQAEGFLQLVRATEWLQAEKA